MEILGKKCSLNITGFQKVSYLINLVYLHVLLFFIIYLNEKKLSLKNKNQFKYQLFLGEFYKESQGDCFEFLNGDWIPKFKLKTERRFASTVTMSDSEAYIIGGEDGLSKPLNVIEKLTSEGKFFKL